MRRAIGAICGPVGADAVIARNPDLVDSLFYCQCRDSHPERAQTFENLVLSMIPTEGGL
jgi:hypothetical protein